MPKGCKISVKSKSLAFSSRFNALHGFLRPFKAFSRPFQRLFKGFSRASGAWLRIVEVSGKHGNLKRDFKHLPIEIFLSDGGKKVLYEWRFQMDFNGF